MATWVYEGIQCYVATDPLTEFTQLNLGAPQPLKAPPVTHTSFPRPLVRPDARYARRTSSGSNIFARLITKHKPLYRSWNGKDHFYTMSKSEYDGLPSGYAREGIQCYILDSPAAGHVPFYRLYNGSWDDHVYTTSESEKGNALSNLGFTPEGIVGYVRTTPVPNHVPLYRANHPGISDHFYTTSMQEIEAVAPRISNAKFKKMIKNKLKKYLKDAKIYLADSAYHCPTLGNAQDIVNNTQVDQRHWIAEKHDCDDFSHLLKGAFIEDAYTNGLRGLPHAFGVVWGNKPAHAMNLVITSNGSRFSLSIIEPQTGSFYRPSDKKLDEIYLIVA